MLKRILQRLSFSKKEWDPAAYWRTRASDPDTMSVMWANLAYNALVDRDEWRVIEDAFPARRGAVLDLGCGTGRMSKRLARAFDTYTGVDLDTMVAEAARRNPELASTYVASTVDGYDYPADRFDMVLSMGCVATACTKESLPRVAANLVKTARPGGHILLVEPFHTSRLLTRGCKMLPSEVSALFASLGAREVRRGGILFFPMRMVLSEAPFAKVPRLTAAAYEAGERVVRASPLFSDYSVLLFEKA